MENVTYITETNTPLSDSVFMLKLIGHTESKLLPGQFVNITIPGVYLRRPISVADANGDILWLIIKEAGKGTRLLREVKPGEKLEILTGLGNGFDTQKSGDTPLLIGGGIGVAPLLYLCKKLAEENKKPNVICGFNTKQEIILENEFSLFSENVTITTLDGSYGKKGTVIDGILSATDYSYVYCCGPMKMMEAVSSAIASNAQFSLEERFGCGFGACMGCTREMKSGYKRICKDGPVFDKEDMIW